MRRIMKSLSSPRHRSFQSHAQKARARARRNPLLERLEDRLVLTAPAGPTLSINSVTIDLSKPGPISVAGELAPGNAVNVYRIDGSAGEQLSFHGVSTTSTNGSWWLVGLNDQTIASQTLGTDFNATLPAAGPYYLELAGNVTSTIDYTFQVSDTSSYPPIASSGFNTEQTGTLAASGTTTYTFQAPAGLPLYFDALSAPNSPITGTLTGPSNQNVALSGWPTSSKAGPFFTPESGTYTLKLTNQGGSSSAYAFNLLALPTAATPLNPGPTQTIAGTLGSANQTAVYSFPGAAGERLAFDGQSTNLTLVRPDGTTFGLSSAPITLTENGTYYLLATTNGSTTSYQFRMSDTAYSPLTFGAETSGTISATGQADVYTFSGTAGENVFFQYKSASNGTAGVYLSLYGPDNQTIAGNWIGYDPSATLPIDGTYTLVVADNTSYSSGTYSFEAFQTVNTTAALSLNTSTTATIANPGDTATYTFNGTVGQRIYFDAIAGDSTNLRAALTGPLGNSIFNNDYAPYDSGPYTLAQAGTYTLTIADAASNGTTGTYTFALDDVAQATSIALTSGQGTSESGTLAPGGSTNLYTFSGTAGQNVFFNGQQDSPSYSAYVNLYGPNDSYVTGFWLESNRSVTLPYAGTYVLAVAGQSQSNASVSYKFTVYDNTSTTAALALNTQVSGTIANPGDTASYTFTGSVGQRIYYDGISDASDLRVALQGPGGQYLLNGNGLTSDYGPFTLAYSGTYTLSVSGNGNGTAGSYTFALDDVAQATNIALASGQGTAESGTLSPGGATNLYTFSGTAGQNVFFQGQQDSPGSGAYATLYGPGDSSITGFYLENNRSATLPYAGTYVLAVAGQNQSNTSVSYKFTVYDNTNTTAALALNTQVSGTIANPGDTASYTFTGSVGQRIYYDGISDASDLRVALQGPEGQYLLNGNGLTSDYGPFTLAYAGTYTLTVSGNGNGTTGAYTFALDDAAQATNIALTAGQGTAESGTLSPGGATKLYTFSGTAGQIAFFNGQQDSPGNGAYATLYGPNDGSVTGFWLENNQTATLPYTGTYVLAVAGQNQANTSVSYQFTVYDTTNTTATLALNTSTKATLKNPGDTASYTFSGSAGQRIYFDAIASDNSNLYASLNGPFGGSVFSYDSAPSDRGPFTLAYAGTYTLTIFGNGNSGATGSYTFALDDVAQATNIALAASPGTTESGTLTPGGSTRLYTFSGTAGQNVSFVGQQDSPASGAYASLFGPNDGYLTGFYLENNQTATLPFTGTYVLAVAGQNQSNTSVSYQFNVSATAGSSPTAPASTALALNTQVSGTIANSGDTVSYTFTGSAGQRIYYDGISDASDLRVTLQGPEGQYLINGYYLTYDNGPFTLAYAGTYTLTVSGNGNATGAYTFALDDVAQATNIALASGQGTAESGTLSPGGSTNLYTFSGTAGENVFFQGQKDVPGYSAYATLYGPNDSSVMSVWLESNNSVTLPYTGTYVLAVAGQNPANASVSYKFTVFDNTSTTAALALNTQVSGTIANPGDTASYTFTGSVGQRIYYDGISDASDLRVTLQGPSGQYLINGYYFTYDNGPFTLAYAGTYTLTVSDNGNGGTTGAYTFALDDAAQATNISLTSGQGTAESGTLSPGGSTNLYTFSGTAGQTVFFNGQQDSPGNGAYATLYGPNNSSVTGFWLENNQTATLPYTGTYVLAVAGQNQSNTSVSYKFTVYDNTSTTAALALNTQVSGTIANPGDTASYTFTGAAGQRIYYDGISDASDLRVTLQGPSGQYLINGYYFTYDNGPFTLAYAGTYTLTVSGNGNGTTGAYTFALDDAAQATSIALASGQGTAESGTLSPGGSTNLYTFSGTAGQTVFFNGQQDSPGGGAYATLYGPNDAYVTAFYLENNQSATLPYTGTYVLAVAGQNQSNTSVNYKFTVYDTTSTTAALALNTQVSGTIANPGDTASYTFTGSVGQRIYYDGISDASDLRVALQGPSGQYLINGYYFTYDNGPFTLAYAGTYTLTVSGNGNGTTGNYTFALDDAAQATNIALTSGQGTSESGTLSPGGSTNLYTFSGTAGQTIFFNGQQDSPGNGAYATLYGPNNGNISGQWLESNAQWTLPYTGTYVLAVAGQNPANSSVSYKFTVYDNTNTTAALALNTQVSGTLTNPGDSATYTFNGVAGQQLQFHPTSPGSYQLATLYDPLGHAIMNRYLYNDSGAFTLATPGAYRLVIATDGTYTGAYAFQLLDLQSSPKLQVGTTEADLTVTLSAPAAGQVLVQYATADGTATVAHGDYKPTSGLLLFQPGQTTATIEIQAIDQVTAVTRQLNVNLSNAVGATIASGGGTGVVTISADEYGTLQGTVYNDTNGNGTRDSGESALNNWTVQLLDGSNHVVATAVTDTSGQYTIGSVLPGTYTLEEVAPSGYITTEPAAPGTYTETVTAGQTIGGLDFGVFQTVTIAGMVYNDSNGNGQHDSGEPGLAGWTIDLLKSSDHSLVTTATTDSNGNYSFNGVGPGSYIVAQEMKSGYVQTSAPATYSVTAQSGQNVSGQDFGDFQTGVIAGTVYNDKNGDGVLESGEAGVSGVTVKLLDSSNNLVATATSASDGTYSFSVTTAGTYTVEDVVPAGSVQTQPGGGVYTVKVQSGLGANNANFGLFQTIAIAGTVYNDVNGNGSRQAGEGGLSGWTVQLVDGSNHVVSTTTAADGTYSFAGVGPGAYTVREVVNSGYVQTSAPTTYSVAAQSGQNVSGQDFGNFQLVSVSGTVFNDLNGDGTRQAGEPGLSGWSVKLVGGPGGTLSATTGTDGTYSFTGVGPGAFSIQVVAQAGYAATTPTSIALATQSGQNVSDQDFGEVQAQTLSGTVYNDTNGDGARQTGEGGLSGVTVKLMQGASVVTTTMTGGDGSYQFIITNPGTYTVVDVVPAGSVQTQPASGSYTVTTTGGQSTANLDFGLFQTIAISGTVYNDLNGDGSRQAGEGGLDAWTVQLVDGSNHVVSTATAPDGTFSFTGVGPGAYTVREVVNNGFVQTSAPATYAVTAQSGQNVSGRDFGNFQLVSLSGTVYNDLDGSGTFNAGDATFSGWTVNLVDSSNHVVATTTNTSGAYLFGNVGPGSYTIQEVPQTGPGGVPYVPAVPATGTRSVTASSGTNQANLDFGNVLQPQVVDVRVLWGTQSMSIVGLDRDLPFIDITGIQYVFNENVAVAQNDLSISSTIGSGTNYGFNGFSFDTTSHAATWSLPTALGVDQLMMVLDGVNMAGVALGKVSTGLSVLPGDFNGDKVVSIADAIQVRNQAIGLAAVTIWGDLNGDGKVDASDFNAARARIGTNLS